MKTYRTTRTAIPTLALSAWLLLTQTGQCYYNPSTGSWLSRDPIEEKGGVNLHAFVRNDPIGKVDVLGKICGPDPCSTARQMGQGPRDSQELGGVVCCGGKKYACVWNTGGFGGKAKDIVWDCIYQHETSHFNDFECPLCDFWTRRPPFKIPVDPDRAECSAWKSSIKCFQNALDRGACGGEPLCAEQLKIAIDIAQDKVAQYCHLSKK